jgi:hypothetical protein
MVSCVLMVSLMTISSYRGFIGVSGDYHNGIVPIIALVWYLIAEHNSSQ